MNKMTPEELEKFIHQTLRALPARPAPRTLEARVVAALEHRAMIPWYHRSWSYWPAAIRATFLAMATGVAGLMVVGFYFLSTGVAGSALAAQAGERLNFLTKVYHFGGWLVDLGITKLGGIPPLWLYGGLGLIAALYATFFGLGAVAYRTLYRNN